MPFTDQTSCQFHLCDILVSIKNADTICQKTKMDSFYSYLKLCVHREKSTTKQFMTHLLMIRNNLTNVTDTEWTDCVNSGALAIDDDNDFLLIIQRLYKALYYK